MTRHPCTDALICPVCERGLAEGVGSFRCGRGHSFDRAREGYVDLLPQGHGRAAIPGDTKEMVRSRRRFLSGGHFQPLVEALTTEVHLATASAAARGGSGVNVLDVGCGEGSYGGRLMDSLPDGSCLYGLDISRDALRAAARAYRSGIFFRNDVATRICVAGASMDVVLDVFAPRNVSEFARVLRTGGLVLTVVPAESHLRELRMGLPMLGIAPEKRERTVEQFSGAFALAREEAVEYVMHLTHAEALDLVRMTPSVHHIDEIELRDASPQTAVTAGFRILGFVKRAS